MINAVFHDGVVQPADLVLLVCLEGQETQIQRTVSVDDNIEANEPKENAC